MTILNSLTCPKPKPKLVKYNSGAGERFVRVVETPKDPLTPPKFKYRRFPRPTGPPPVPVLHSPPRQLTVEDQKDWKVPPCVSLWKNPKGHVIPLDKRHAGFGRELQELKINDNFATFSEALYVTEQAAREKLELKAKMVKKLELMEREKKEKELLELARKVPKMMKKHNEKRSAVVRKKVARDGERDVSEKVALGMASVGAGEMTYDERLFNQDSGLDSGFADDDRYNVFEKDLLAGQSGLSGLCRPKRERAVEGEAEADDPFGLDHFCAQVKKGRISCS